MSGIELTFKSESCTNRKDIRSDCRKESKAKLQARIAGLTAWLIAALALAGCSTVPESAEKHKIVHPWQMQEIVLTANQDYDNFYTDVDVWVQLQGPGFNKRVYGFWDGDNRFIVRVVATAPGHWQWQAGSNQVQDSGLNNLSGEFDAVPWTTKELAENPNRRGFVTVSENGHALKYADGTPFFMAGDTWLAGSTWRLPYRDAATSAGYTPGPGIGFEDAVIYRKQQGFNSVSMIAAFPNWDSDTNPSTYADSNGVFLRNAWEKFGYDVADGKGTDASGGLSYWGTYTAKNMRDERGNLPFAKSSQPGLSDFNRINPDYFKSLDNKMRFLSEQGFVPLLETVRRDAGPGWNAYNDFNPSFARYTQYLISRYGGWNMLFSGIHLDWVPKDFSLTAEQFNAALTYHLNKYGPPPFGQIHTALIDRSTYTTFGHGKDVPWMAMHSVGNKPRDHRVGAAMETIFALNNPVLPVINFEPYYTGWRHEINKPGGEQPAPDSDRDNYFSRAQMYGSVLSGGLCGHVHGTAAYDITTTGEPDGARPHIWTAMRYRSANYMRHLVAFVTSEGAVFQQLKPASGSLLPRKSPQAPEDGLDGWAYMMRTADTHFSLLYLENDATVQQASGFEPDSAYVWSWFSPVSGEWLNREVLYSDSRGSLVVPAVPVEDERENKDWAAKIIKK